MRVAWLFDCELHINPWFALLLLAAMVGGFLPEALIIIGSLLTHELAHLVVGRGLGLEFRRIYLLPYGGVAQIDNLYAADPPAVAATALAGPLNNLILFALSYLLVQVGWLVPPTGDFMMRTNLSLALFNLLPALPLDGGRLLQALLRDRVGELTALRRLVRWGYVVAGCMVMGAVVAALFGIPLVTVPVLAVFVAMGARKEMTTAVAGQLLRLWRRPAELARRRVLPAVSLVAAGDVQIRHLLEHLSGPRYHLIWVLDGEADVCGKLTEGQILRAALQGQLNLTLRELLR